MASVCHPPGLRVGVCGELDQPRATAQVPRAPCHVAEGHSPAAASGEGVAVSQGGKQVRRLEQGPAGLQHMGYKRPRPMSSSAPSMMVVEEETSPQDFLRRILSERGYDTEILAAKDQPFFHPPTVKQVEDYDLALVTAVKRGDLEMVKQLASMGRRMDACNKHGESIVHISCRRGHVDLLRFLLDNGGRVETCDDLGRTPLHDACWAKTPVFECVMLVLERNLRLLRVEDCRGATPLHYIKREHWAIWRQFFDMKKEEYWAPLNGVPERVARPYPGAVPPSAACSSPSSVARSPTSVSTISSTHTAATTTSAATSATAASIADTTLYLGPALPVNYRPKPLPSMLAQQQSSSPDPLQQQRQGLPVKLERPCSPPLKSPPAMASPASPP